MSILDYRQAVIDKLKTSFPQLQDVQSHPGKFTIEDIKRLCLKTPAAFVAVLSAPGKEKISTGQMLFDVSVAVFIATRHKTTKNAEAQGWKLAEAIATLAMWNQFSFKAFPAQTIEIENLWSSALDKDWSCIMAVAWDMQVLIGDDIARALLEATVDNPFVFDDDTFNAVVTETISAPTAHDEGMLALESTHDNPPENPVNVRS